MKATRFLILSYSLQARVIALNASNQTLYEPAASQSLPTSEDASSVLDLAISSHAQQYERTLIPVAPIQSPSTTESSTNDRTNEHEYTQPIPVFGTSDIAVVTALHTQDPIPSSFAATQLGFTALSSAAQTTIGTTSVKIPAQAASHAEPVVVPISQDDVDETVSALTALASTQSVAYALEETPDPHLAAIAYETSSSEQLEATRNSETENPSSTTTEHKDFSDLLASESTTHPALKSSTLPKTVFSLINGFLGSVPETKNSLTSTAAVNRLSSFLETVIPSFLSLPTVESASTIDSVLERRSESTNEIVQTTSAFARPSLETPPTNNTQIHADNAQAEADTDDTDDAREPQASYYRTVSISDVNTEPTPSTTTSMHQPSTSSSPSNSASDALSLYSSSSNGAISSHDPASEPSIPATLQTSFGNLPFATTQARETATNLVPSDDQSEQQNVTNMAFPPVKPTQQTQMPAESSTTQAQVHGPTFSTELPIVALATDTSSMPSVLASSQLSPYNRIATIGPSTIQDAASSMLTQTQPIQSQGSNLVSGESEQSSKSSSNLPVVSTSYTPLPQITMMSSIDLTGHNHLSDAATVAEQVPSSSQTQHSLQTTLAAVDPEQDLLSGTMSSMTSISTQSQSNSLTSDHGLDDSSSGLVSTTSTLAENTTLTTQVGSEPSGVPITGISDMASATTALASPSVSISLNPTISRSFSSSFASQTEPSMSLPPIILTAQSDPLEQSYTVNSPSVSASATPVSVSLPGAIAPASGMILPSTAQVIVQIGFTAPLNYPFVVSNALTTAQIFSYLPRALAEALTISPDTIVSNSLRPLQQSNYTATVAYVVISKAQQITLGQLIANPHSALYSQSDVALQSLVNLIDSDIPLLPTANRVVVTTSATTTATRVAPDGNLANYGSLAEILPASTTGSSTQKIAGIGGGAAIAASVYACLMFFIARRYRLRPRQTNTLSSSTSRRKANRLRHGRTHLPISSPTNVENSLGI